MKLNIDSLDSVTGWVINAPSTIMTITEKKYIAGLNTSSLLIKFDDDDTTRTLTKTFGTPFDVTNYDSLVFNIWSQTKGFDKLYIKPTDFAYKISLDGVTEFYIPVWSTFCDIEIGIEDITEINQIQITPLHDDTDYIIISEMVAEKEQLPLDILNSVKEYIDHYVEADTGDGLLLGTVNASVGATSINLDNPAYLDRYGVVKIDDGVNNELHQVEDNDAEIFQLNSNYDGSTILNNYTGANVYLQYPSYINPGQNEIRLPGIAIWGIDPEPIESGKLETIRDTWQASGVSKERREGQIYRYRILITCESRSQMLLDTMSRIVRKIIALKALYINARKHEISFFGKAEELKPNSGIDYVGQIQYSLELEVTENLEGRASVPVTSSITTTINIQ